MAGLAKGTRIWFLVRHWDKKLRRKFRLSERRGFKEKTIDPDRLALKCQPPPPVSELSDQDRELLEFVVIAQRRRIL